MHDLLNKPSKQTHQIVSISLLSGVECNAPSVVAMYVTDIYKEIICDRGLLWAGSPREGSRYKIIKTFRLNVHVARDNFYPNPD